MKVIELRPGFTETGQSQQPRPKLARDSKLQEPEEGTGALSYLQEQQVTNGATKIVTLTIPQGTTI